MKIYITDESLSKEAILDLQKQGVDFCIITEKVDIGLTIDRLCGMGCPLSNKNLVQEFGACLLRATQDVGKTALSNDADVPDSASQSGSGSQKPDVPLASTSDHNNPQK